MINIDTIEVSGFKGAIYGMRNPFKNREKSDSAVYDADKDGNPIFTIGDKDLELCQKLLRAGGDDANSESTMHTITKREITLDDFSWETLDFDTIYDCCGDQITQTEWSKMTIGLLNHTRERYLKAVERKDPQSCIIWKQLIQMLPSSYMQKRTVDLNYQTLRRIFFARRHHKLTEWSGGNGFCSWIKTLPYAEELITYEEKAH